MLEDTLEGLEDTDELEEAAQQEVDKVFLLNFSAHGSSTKFMKSNECRSYGR